MKLTHTHIYKQPIDAIYASCMNESFIKAKMQALGARNIEVHISKKETTTTVEIIREITETSMVGDPDRARPLLELPLANHEVNVRPL